MSKHIFTVAASFRLAYLTQTPQESDEIINKYNDGYSLVEGETIDISPLTIGALKDLNQFVRRKYMEVQRDICRDWNDKDRNAMMRLAMDAACEMTIGTDKGNKILFDTIEGNMYYAWAYVREFTRPNGSRPFIEFEAWERTIRPDDIRVYQTIMNRFNSATFELALMNDIKGDGELAEKDLETDKFMDNAVATLIAAGMTKEEALGLSIEQANKVIERAYALRHGEPEVKKVTAEPPTQSPEQFESSLKGTLGEGRVDADGSIHF